MVERGPEKLIGEEGDWERAAAVRPPRFDHLRCIQAREGGGSHRMATCTTAGSRCMHSSGHACSGGGEIHLSVSVWQLGMHGHCPQDPAHHLKAQSNVWC
uniref:Uncharacterized protein n=1 Tax=Oryza meridionalis TaxID=40149 RepID=A0A0E0E3Y1_9ORYZ